ncbi:pentapeptide repeat-containing protein [Phnomibacter ginsenosidimutans]|nr:pentapeptide repeat-containing protein [Phnomibacter ginsenosidimutans]
MSADYAYDEHFTPDNLDASQMLREYEQCSFSGFAFSGYQLQGKQFSDCSFTDCDLSMANIEGTAFREVRFIRCKLVGLQFDGCNPFLFEIQPEGCQLQLAAFANMKLKQARFVQCHMHEVDFSNADLSKASFTDCDLAGAIFDNTNLEQADFRTAIHYAIDPAANRMKKAKFSINGLPGLLHKYQLDIS